MASMKRKQAPNSKHTPSSPPKKVKKTSLPRPQDEKEKETEFDSDPIIESDTNSESGEDDGVSWPEDEEPEEFAGIEEKQDEAPQPRETDAPEGYAEVVERSKQKPVSTATNSRESHAKQKALARERKAAKPNADPVARSKKLWEQLRRKSHVQLEERRVLIDELFSIITGHVRDFVFKHDSVRVIQTALKYANKDQRRMVTRELQGDYRTLAEGRYSKFLLGKMLVYGDSEIRDLIVPAFYGSVRKFINHPEAAWVLDDIYRGAATAKQKAVLLREWYGADLAILLDGGSQEEITADLKQILTASPEKKTPILKSLHGLINQLVQKKKTGFTMLHDAMLQYVTSITPGSSEFSDFMEPLKGDEEGDLLKNLAFTASGAELVSLALAYGSAKDRKQILRAYKGTIQSMAWDKNARKVLLTAYEVVDDTVLSSKSILLELVGKAKDEGKLNEGQEALLTSMIHDLSARIPLLYLYTPRGKGLSMASDDQKLLTRVLKIRETTSKKDPVVRRSELLAQLSPLLLPYAESHVSNLIRSQTGCQFLTDVLLGASTDTTPALRAIARLPHNSDPEVQTALSTPSVDRMLKALVLGGRYNPSTNSVERLGRPINFHDMLYAEIENQLLVWATGGHSFVILALLEAEGFSSRDEVLKRLNDEKGQIESAAKGMHGGKGNAGAKLLLEKL